jgi:L-fuconolactonase
MVIDAHQHFWKLDLPFQYDWLRAERHAPICRDFLPEDLAPLMREAGVDRTVFVQTQHNVEENRWVLGLAEQHPWIVGVVGWVDLASADCERQVEEFKSFPKFVGVRHIVQDEPDDNFIIRPEILLGLKVLERHQLPFDLLFFVKHLPHAANVARAVPNLPLVIDHLSKPQIKAGQIENWLPHLRKAAECENVFCKLSGMVTEADWKAWRPSDLKPYVEAALELFGPERCMFGSDWPVCELAASYPRVVGALRETVGKLSDAEEAAIFCGTAARFYGLKL